jgi:cell division protease FtsH
VKKSDEKQGYFQPGSKGPQKKKGPLKFPGNFWIYGVVVVIILLVAGRMDPFSKPPMPVAYSEFKNFIKDSKVSEVWISNEEIQAKINENGTSKNILTSRLPDDSLVPLLESKGIKFEARRSNTWLSEFFLSWVLPMVILFVLWQFVIGRSMKQGPPGLMAFGKSRAKLSTGEKEKTTFADVAGCEEAKEELLEVVQFLQKPEKFREIGGRIPKGVLLVGPPGTGKTLLARAVAGEAQVNFYSISGSDFVEMFVGVGAARVRDLFQEAKKNSPCIIFIDELDAIAKSRQTSGFQSNDEREQTLNQILVEMDGFDNHSGVIIMAATNRPEVLDSAILRPGRFDRQIVVERPDLQGRLAILKVHSANVKMEEDIDLLKVATRTPGFTGADLANVVNEAALLAVRKSLLKVNQKNFEDALDRVVAGLAKKNRVISESEKRVISVHEIGHALVAKFTSGSDKVHRISIVPRSSGALGFTMQIPEEDRHLMSERQLRGMVRVLLGGRAAEHVVIGEVTSGAQDDLRRASAIVRRMISEFGMGQSLGLVSLSSHAPGYLENPFVRDDSLPISNELAGKMDKEIRKTLDEEFENACTIIRNHRDTLERLVSELLKKETLEAEDFEQFLGSEA